MDIETLLSTHGLFDSISGNKIRWFETMASEVAIDMEDDEADYSVLNLSGIISGDYVQVKYNAEVKVGETGEYVFVEAINGRTYYFSVYKPLDAAEVAALLS